MRAVVYDRAGPATDVLRVVDLAMPEPEPGEVRVRIVRSAVNPTDWKVRSGTLSRGVPFEFQVPNQDGSGVIDKVGPGVDEHRIGERVWVYLAAYQRQFGTAEEFVCLPQHQAVHLDDKASFELGASLGVPAMTAHYSLFCDGPLTDKTVLVPGGAGAVGHFAIELARWKGARVITTVSSNAKADLAKQAGAAHIINYREQDVVAEVKKIAPDGVDRIIEVAPENLDIDLEVIAHKRTILFYASTAAEPVLNVRRLMYANVTLKFMVLYTVGQEHLDRAIEDIGKAMHEGALSELPPLHFPLEQTVHAHEAVEQHAVGKVFIDVG